MSVVLTRDRIMIFKDPRDNYICHGAVGMTSVEGFRTWQIQNVKVEPS